MNVSLNPSQSNTRQGVITLLAKDALTGLEGRLCQVVNDGGVAKAAVPTAVTTICIFIVAAGAAAASEVQIEPIASNDQCRVRAYGTGNAGDILVLADPTANSGAQAGMVAKIGATAGQYFSPGIAEEAFVDGQLVLVRPLPRLVRVASADTLTALTFTSGGATGPEVAALRTAIHTCLTLQGLMA